MFYALVIQMTDAADAADAATAPPPQSPVLSSRNDKRERKQTAQVLPPGITHNMMNKYVVYYREMVYLKNGKQVPREYFKVESHPKLDKPWVTSKSAKISLLEKLHDANEYVTKLSATASTSASAITTRLPKYTMLRVVRDTPTATILSLVYDRKDNLNGFRWTCSHTFSSTTATVVALEHLQEKLREKYGVNIAGI
jgi:hypothetical protein